jgi:hypothetical protein
MPRGMESAGDETSPAVAIRTTLGFLADMIAPDSY